MKNFDKRIKGIERRAGLEEDKNVIDEIPGNMFQVRNTKRNAAVVLPHTVTPEEWNGEFARDSEEDKEEQCTGIF